MRVILAYLVASAIVSFVDQLAGSQARRVVMQVVNEGRPRDVSETLRKIFITSGLTGGVLCSLVFVFVGQSSPMLHSSIVALFVLTVSLVLWWFNRRSSVLGELPEGTESEVTWKELVVHILPFLGGLLLTTGVAVSLMKSSN